MHRRSKCPPSTGGNGWFLAGYAGLAGFLALEVATRERGSASRLEASPDDQGTTRRIVSAYAVAVCAVPALRRQRLFRLAPGLAVLPSPAWLWRPSASA